METTVYIILGIAVVLACGAIGNAMGSKYPCLRS